MKILSLRYWNGKKLLSSRQHGEISGEEISQLEKKRPLSTLEWVLNQFELFQGNF